MSTGRAEHRSKREIFEAFTLVVIVTIALVGLCFGVYLHKTVHSENSCSMTYMYRKLQFMDVKFDYVKTNKYSLSVYNEGHRWWNRSTIEADQIPVLFIPGSQGSAKQVRSLASVMQNKTEMKRSPFSFRFFAVDFDEEKTFMNGNIMSRQLDYVMAAIRKIQSMMRVKRKIVLVGHSYGGMIALLATIHPEFHTDIELVIVKGSPINKTPVLVDWLSMRHLKHLMIQWGLLQATTLEHVGVVAYSGGLRDYQIPDEWSKMRNVTHRPLWAIDKVSDLGADHLAILWCNEFVRHVSRVLYSYGENMNKYTGRQIVKQFYKKDIDRNIKRANLVSHIDEVPTREIIIGKKYENFTLRENQSVLLLKPERFQVFSVRINASCVNSVTTVRYHESMMHFKNATDGAVETWIYRAIKGEKVRLLLNVTSPCNVDIQTTSNLMIHLWRLYEIMFSHFNEVGAMFITASCFFAILLREPQLQSAVIMSLINIAAIVAVLRGSVDTSDTIALPMAMGYVMALGHRLICFLADVLVLSKLRFIKKAHRALRDDMLMNGLFLIGAALTITASNEGSVFLIILMAFRHHPRAVLLVAPALVPYVLKLVSVPLFTIDAMSVEGLQYHPAFYMFLIYLWGLFSSLRVGEVTMRVMIYGITPCFLYLCTFPMELFSGFVLLLLGCARFLTYPTVKQQSTALVPPESPRPAVGRLQKQLQKQNYNLRSKKR